MIQIEFIPHAKQRYDTAGDWIIDKEGNINIYVSDTGNQDYNSLIAVHELWEMLLCVKRGITQEAVDAFDMKFEGSEEPGDQPDSPYHREHCSATGVERLLCAELNVAWKDYEHGISSMIGNVISSRETSSR